MTTLRLWLNRLLALMRGRRLDRELDEQVVAHLELAERDAIAAGLSPAEARRAARLRFGGVERMREAHRDKRSLRWIDTLLRDMRHGLGSLARAPGVTAIIVGVLAIGIGANAAMFSLLDAVLLKPLPFPEPDRIARVWEAPRPGVVNATTVPDFLDWQRLATTFDALAAENGISVALTGTGEPRRLAGRAVTTDYFKVFATRARLGRTFTEEDQQHAGPVVILSHAAWHTYFGGDPHILQRRLVLDGEAHQVIGVLPPGVFDRDRAKLWTLLRFTPEQLAPQIHWLTVHGRLRDGVSLAQARQQMRAIHAALTRDDPDDNPEETVVVEPVSRLLVGDDVRQTLFLLFGAAALVLLIACANVASLLIAKGAARGKELAVRAALGASRGRLVAQLLTESLILCLLGGAAGVGLAFLVIGVATPTLSQTIPYTADVTVDARLLVFATAVALGVTVLVGALPALQISIHDLARVLHRTTRGSSGSYGRLRRAIVVGEVALSLVLMSGAGLLLKSLLNLRQLDTGARIDNIITVAVDLPAHAYDSAASAMQFYQTVGEQLHAVPGVVRAALSTHLPLEWIRNGERLFVDGVDLGSVRFKRVDSGYFEAFDIPLAAGRGLTPRDRDGAPRVVAINEALERHLAGAAGIDDPVGQTIELTCPAYAGEEPFRASVEIVGVIRSERVDAPWQPDPPVVYVPLAQVPASAVLLVVRTQAEPTSVVPGIREAVRRVDPNLPLGDVVTMEQMQDRTLSVASRPAGMVGAFAAVAALLAALGLYGVASHTVALRQREIGIRVALGAQRREVVSEVLRSALAMVVIGLLFGLVGTVVLVPLIRAFLFDVSPVDPLALSLACVAMIGVGLLAGAPPACRAAGVDPVTVLRDDG